MFIIEDRDLCEFVFAFAGGGTKLFFDNYESALEYAEENLKNWRIWSAVGEN